MCRAKRADLVRQVPHLAVLLSLATWLLAPVAPARADRFGLPSQGRVTVDMAVVYSQPDSHSDVVGPIGQEAHLALLDQARDRDGDMWTQTQLGFVQADLVREDTQPWVAEVRVPSVSIYAKPFPDGGVRRTAGEGDLLRVTGVSPGLEGDSHVWWATTEGYVAQTRPIVAFGMAGGWVPAEDATPLLIVD